ncbi:unnamed protein product [Brassica rapa]|uniref:Uncharacterized protein n=1 Tax=Brassica campestris TaxID=3711 RepID=A0A3P5YSM5_BRACM|nr:unnamed protein product [Brassica rapa]VDC63721.1 unnamed protein product [Brassica rapa]
MNGTSWADQWDNSAKGGRIGGGAVSGGGGLDKTKALASSGFKKLKTGSAIGFRWVKDKYHKTTNKH